VKLLLDTHAIVWWLCSPTKLSTAALTALSDGANEILVSAACGYEIEIKRDRDETLRNVPESLKVAVLEQGFIWLSISAEQAIAAALLPMHHRDPWDRILIAQALEEGAQLVSCDARMESYGVPILW
jgi:PIN domain nuclease of toxin-antitoxin system